MDLKNGIPMPVGRTLFPLSTKKNLNYVNGFPENFTMNWKRGLLYIESVLPNKPFENAKKGIYTESFGLYSVDTINSNISLLKILNGEYLISKDEIMLYAGINGYYRFGEHFRISFTTFIKNILKCKLNEVVSNNLLDQYDNINKIILPKQYDTEINFICEKAIKLFSSTISYMKDFRKEYNAFNVSTFSNILSFLFLSLHRSIQDQILSLPNKELIIDSYLNTHEPTYQALIENLIFKEKPTILHDTILKEANEIINNEETILMILKIINDIIYKCKNVKQDTYTKLAHDVCDAISASINISFMSAFLHSEKDSKCKTELYFYFLYPNKYKNVR